MEGGEEDAEEKVKAEYDRMLSEVAEAEHFEIAIYMLTDWCSWKGAITTCARRVK